MLLIWFLFSFSSLVLGVNFFGSSVNVCWCFGFEAKTRQTLDLGADTLCCYWINYVLEVFTITIEWTQIYGFFFFFLVFRMRFVVVNYRTKKRKNTIRNYFDGWNMKYCSLEFHFREFKLILKIQTILTHFLLCLIIIISYFHFIFHIMTKINI